MLSGVVSGTVGGREEPAGKKRSAGAVRLIMTTLADRTIAALRTVHDDLAALVPGLSPEQLTGPSAATEWTVAQVLSHLGSGAEIALASLQAALSAAPAPGADFNPGVWDRWNAMSPDEQAAGFLDHDERLVATFEGLTAEQRETTRIDLGYLPAPVPVATLAGLRLNESAAHAWDVRVAVDPAAGLDGTAGQLLAEQYTGGLGVMLGFIGKADALAAPAVVEIEGSGFGFDIADRVGMTASVTGPTATFAGPLEAAIRLVTGRLTPDHTSGDVAVTGAVTLDDLRRVFPGF